MSAERHGTAVVATGAAIADDPARYSRNSPSFFVDPAGWLVADAVDKAFAACAEDILDAGERIGVVVLSNEGPARTMRAIAATAASGMVSPLRFAGANPGVLAGLPCIRWKLRGPTLAFTMDPAAGLDAATTVVSGWLAGGQADYVVVATHCREGDRHVARCAIVRDGVSGPTLADVLMPGAGPVT